MDKNNNKLRPLGELKFDSVGDEYLFLFETLVRVKEDLSDKSSIEELRVLYRELVSSEGLDDRYEKSSIYWSDVQENAIVLFLKEPDLKKRDAIFSKHLYRPLRKLVENIVFTYKLFRNDVDITELQSDCVSFLVTKLEKYDHRTGAKAFAYLGTIAKHYLMGGKRVAHKVHKSNVDIDTSIDEASDKPENIYHLEDDLHEVDPQSKIFDEIIKQVEAEIQKPKALPNDKKVGEAIVWVFKNHEILQVYNKNLVYHLLKERTGLHTKEITYSLSRFKSFYKIFKEDFFRKTNNK